MVLQIVCLTVLHYVHECQSLFNVKILFSFIINMTTGMIKNFFLIFLTLYYIRYDTQSHYVFAGMSNGEIVVLQINKNSFLLVSTLKGHEGEISK